MSCPIRGAGFACLMPTCWSLPISWQTRQENLVISVQKGESGCLGCQEGGVGESGSWTPRARVWVKWAGTRAVLEEEEPTEEPTVPVG